MLENIFVLVGLASISALADTRSASNVSISKWGASGEGNFFIQVNHTEFVDGNQKWIRVPTKEMWAQVLTIATTGQNIGYMVVERFGPSNNAVYNLPTTCRLEWVQSDQ